MQPARAAAAAETGHANNTRSLAVSWWKGGGLYTQCLKDIGFTRISQVVLAAAGGSGPQDPPGRRRAWATFDFVEATFDFVDENGNNVERVYHKI